MASPRHHHEPAPHPAPSHIPLVVRCAAELVGTAFFLAFIFGSGIQAIQLTDDAGIQLMANSLTTALGLGAMILLLGPISGAHFNPAITLAVWWTSRNSGRGITTQAAIAYIIAQFAGAVAGAILANAMFAFPLVDWATQDRSEGHLLLSEVVATGGLILLLFGLSRTGRTDRFAAVGVASYVGAAIWFTSSTGFANPALTVGRMFSDMFDGIDPSSVPAFIGMQVVGIVAAVAVGSLIFRPADHGPG